MRQKETAPQSDGNGLNGGTCNTNTSNSNNPKSIIATMARDGKYVSCDVAGVVVAMSVTHAADLADPVYRAALSLLLLARVAAALMESEVA